MMGTDCLVHLTKLRAVQPYCFMTHGIALLTDMKRINPIYNCGGTGVTTRYSSCGGLRQSTAPKRAWPSSVYPMLTVFSL